MSMILISRLTRVFDFVDDSKLCFCVLHQTPVLILRIQVLQAFSVLSLLPRSVFRRMRFTLASHACDVACATSSCQRASHHRHKRPSRLANPQSSSAGGLWLGQRRTRVRWCVGLLIAIAIEKVSEHRKQQFPALPRFPTFVLHPSFLGNAANARKRSKHVTFAGIITKGHIHRQWRFPIRQTRAGRNPRSWSSLCDSTSMFFALVVDLSSRVSLCVFAWAVCTITWRRKCFAKDRGHIIAATISVSHSRLCTTTSVLM